MKVILPSNGLLGTRWVDLREPTFADLRSTIRATEDQFLFKHEFVKRLCEFDDNKITMDDVQYLYDVAATAVTFKTVTFSVKCPECGAIAKSDFMFGESETPVRTLDKDSRRCSKTIEGVEYHFHILSAADGVAIHTYALDDDDSERMIEEATVCRVLGYDITDESIEKVRNLPIAIYVACFLYINANWHGMDIRKEVECTACGKKSTTKITLDSSWVKMDLAAFIGQFASVRDCLDFKSYLKFTVPEFKNFVDYLNAEAKKKDSSNNG